MSTIPQPVLRDGDSEQAREVTGPELLGRLASREAELLGQKLRTAYTTVSILKDDAGHRTPEWDSLDGLWDDLWQLSRDAGEAGSYAREREVGAELIAAARRSNHLDAIVRAEQLLAAERRTDREAGAR